ncbi:MAG: S8 family serine peptidase [Flavobacteriales bacterium]|nr:S8 family serine peptidase [Flavobacteriales bacterium]
MRSEVIVCTLLLLLSISSIGQRIKELPISYERVLSDEEMRVIIDIDTQDLRSYSDRGDLKVLTQVDDYKLVSTTKEVILEMVSKGEIGYIETQTATGRPLNDVMVNNNNIIPIRQGIAPLDTAYTGAGVIIGMIDTGVELHHPDFLNPDGTTRILELWDHTFEYDEEHIPEPYGFGTRWTQEEIDQGLAVHQDQAIWFGHGSTVTGTACGNGSAVNDFMGVAPKSDMVIVSFDFTTTSFLADVMLAVQYIFEVADEHQKPCVINMSLGTYYGSHDANDPAALFIESELEQPGRIIAAAVGNSNALDPYHLGVELQSDTSFSWFEVEDSPVVGGSRVSFDIWADSVNLSGIEFRLGGDILDDSIRFRGVSDSFHYSESLGQVILRPIRNASNEVLGTAQIWSQYQGEQVQMQVYISDPDSSDYIYRLIGSGTGAYDIWSTSTFGTSDMVQAEDIPELIGIAEMENFTAPDRLMHMVSSWACSDKVITVGNYMNRTSYLDYTGTITSVEGTDGDIYITSSAGPTRDGRHKPDIAATGSVTLSTGNFPQLENLIQNEPFKVAPGGMHFRNGGSSMASPVLAGLAALFLEQCPEARWSDFKEAVIQTSALDEYTGAVPNPYWGYGKVNGFGLMAYDAIIPTIQQVGEELIASGGVDYQWYVDGMAIPGAEDSVLIFENYGDYQVEVFNENGCSVFSETLLVTDVVEQDLMQWTISPNPTKDVLSVQGVRSPMTIELMDSYGNLILRERITTNVRLDLSDLAKGLYMVRGITENNNRVRPFIKH